MDVHATIGKLVDGWCERRALSPLRIVLPSWPPLSGLTDEVHHLWAAMRHVRAVCRYELVLHGELDDVNAVVAEMSRLLHPGEPPQDVERLAERITAAIFGDQLSRDARGG
jgi:hypothetical protein